ncbi:hypothetical protein PHK61_21225 [Actinomycetospora lutea]|uniref:hypothetical protein n=1 Tax=Actinomycetospora lutea TaxID=663604 RepID=UPI00236650D3|nr:hypothetical protein [Actinomycetospora lutea]MDD7940946.1 hypothetical protein [Actinomycetospora lutea]
MTEQAGAQRSEGGSDSSGSTDATSPGAAGADTSGAASSGEQGADASAAADSSTSTSSGAAASGAAASGSGAGGSGAGSEGSSASATTATATKDRPADDPPPDEAPTTQQRTPDVSGGSGPRGRDERSPLNVGELVWKVATVLASVIRIVAYVIAVVLVAYVLLTLVGVNPQNAIAQVVGGVADSTVLAFRDLFLVADPVFAVVVNYGLAAVFWVLVAEFGSRLVRWLGARFS